MGVELDWMEWNAMRVVCWNMRRATERSSAWRLLEDLDPDIAFLQEVASMPGSIKVSYSVIHKRAIHGSGRTQAFGSSILSRTLLRPLTLKTPIPWVTDEMERLGGHILAA